MLREYRPAHGRWTSPDPAGLGVVDPTNPQTWNRYAYVLNDPTALIDLLGDGCYDASGWYWANVGEALCEGMSDAGWSWTNTTYTQNGITYNLSVTQGPGGVLAFTSPGGEIISDAAAAELGLFLPANNYPLFLNPFVPAATVGGGGGGGGASAYIGIGRVLLRNLSGPEGHDCVSSKPSGVVTLCNFDVVASCTNQPAWTTNGVLDGPPGLAGWWSFYVCTRSFFGIPLCVPIPFSATKTADAGPHYCPNPHW